MHAKDVFHSEMFLKKIYVRLKELVKRQSGSLKTTIIIIILWKINKPKNIKLHMATDINRKRKIWLEPQPNTGVSVFF